MKIKSIDEHENKLIDEVRYNPNMKGEYTIEDSDSLNINSKKIIGMISTLSIMTLLDEEEHALEDDSVRRVIIRMLTNAKNKLENKGINL